MKKTSVFIVCLFLAMGVKIQAATIAETVNTNSTEGNYYGGIYFSFSVTGDSVPWGGTLGKVDWKSSEGDQTINFQGSQISLVLRLSGGEVPDELNIISAMSVKDPKMNIYGHLGDGGNNVYEEKSYLFHSGTPSSPIWTNSVYSGYYDVNLNTNTVCSYGFILNINFDGSVGTGTGTWYINYPAPPITPTPEPAVTLELALGGFCLWLARARQSRRHRRF